MFSGPQKSIHLAARVDLSLVHPVMELCRGLADRKPTEPQGLLLQEQVIFGRDW